MGGPAAFVAGYAVAAALLGLWLDMRTATRRPEGLGRRAGHLVTALLALQLGSVVLARYATGATLGLQEAALAAYLPCFVYVFLASAWLLRGFAELVRSHG
ncbi:MAG TPA: hypothetical protein VFI37_10105 [Gaiellaceae bacterium]|nr:hypothetical protein [Gaiellaceae bacterium]